MQTKIEYGVWDTESQELQVSTGEDRERAFRIADLWNRKDPGVVTVVTRTVTTSDWEPANTGVVPPMRGDVRE